MTKKTEHHVTLSLAEKDDLSEFKQELQDAFMVGLIKNFPEHDNPINMGPLPSMEDIEESLYAQESVIYHLLLNGEKVGGVVLRIDTNTHRNKVDLLYIKTSTHGLGIGTMAWQTIEAAFPETKVWEIVTPYFEKRNIHFYINKCGFHIVAFFAETFEVDGRDKKFEFFRFEKVMK